VFKNDMAGTVVVNWSKIQEIQSSEWFAAIPKNVKLHDHEHANTVPQGALSMTGGKQLQVNTGTRQRGVKRCH
jgi:hypothetical protein